MKLIINDTISIFEIQDQFSKKYPFLKIEFFSQPHDIHVGSRKENLIPANLQLKDCRKKHNEGTIELEPETTVAQLEKQFQEIFGLYIQVFRKSGNVWIETTVTDDWTFAKQNDEAESFYQEMESIKRNDPNPPI